jgi:hypothetical protein
LLWLPELFLVAVLRSGSVEVELGWAVAIVDSTVCGSAYLHTPVSRSWIRTAQQYGYNSQDPQPISTVNSFVAKTQSPERLHTTTYFKDPQP